MSVLTSELLDAWVEAQRAKHERIAREALLPTMRIWAGDRARSLMNYQRLLDEQPSPVIELGGRIGTGRTR